MKLSRYLVAVLFASTVTMLRAGTLPVITTQPQSQTVSTNVNATLSVAATGATQYQWRFNGSNIPGATSSTLVVSNTQLTNTGYYLALAGNDTGWVPSTLAYLSVVDVAGTVPFSNSGNPNARAMMHVCAAYNPVNAEPITNGQARVVAGPQLDQMKPIGIPASVINGYFTGADRSVTSVTPGQIVYYRIDITYNSPCGMSLVQPSATMTLTAGGDAYPVPSTSGLRFPIYIEWPDPIFFVFDDYNPTNKVCQPGETASFELQFYDSASWARPTPIQWRKDGIDIPNATNRVITLTNVQMADVGVYDAVAYGGYQPAISPKYFLKLQQTNGQGVLKSARVSGGSLLCDLEGMPGRKYGVEWSTNLINWSSLLTVTNFQGSVTFTNPLVSNSKMFYRATLLP